MLELNIFHQQKDNFYFSSFDTIAGSGKNGAIVHYRATKNNTKLLKKNELFLCDSGGQYKFGTTDVTRTICFKNQNRKIKDIFTNVLKGHIAVVNTDLNKKKTGRLIDIEARKFLVKNNQDYNHGTGHGVGFFLNVHEGPQAISKQNSVKIQNGMILSNEPGYYKQGKFGIRIENLIYAKKVKNKLIFKNLTLVPIEKDLINFKLLTKREDAVRRCSSEGYECEKMAIEKIKHFVSKEAFNIDGFGKKIVENFWNLNLIKFPHDIFKLDYTKIENLEGWGTLMF